MMAGVCWATSVILNDQSPTDHSSIDQPPNNQSSITDHSPLTGVVASSTIRSSSRRFCLNRSFVWATRNVGRLRGRAGRADVTICRHCAAIEGASGSGTSAPHSCRTTVRCSCEVTDRETVQIWKVWVCRGRLGAPGQAPINTRRHGHVVTV